MYTKYIITRLNTIDYLKIMKSLTINQIHSVPALHQFNDINQG